jgi:hypothetical protein
MSLMDITSQTQKAATNPPPDPGTMGTHAAMIRASLEPPTFPTFPEFLEMIASYAKFGLDEHDKAQMREFADGFEAQWNRLCQ